MPKAPTDRAKPHAAEVSSEKKLSVDAQQQQPDSLDNLLDIQLVHSEPGKLRVRCVVNPENRVHMKVADIRLKELCEPGNLAVTSALSKTLRKNGALLPTHGMHITTRRGKWIDSDSPSGTAAGHFPGAGIA